MLAKALASQIEIFAPAKYGMIPELVPATRLSRANGLINMMTNVAVIAGDDLDVDPLNGSG